MWHQLLVAVLAAGLGPAPERLVFASFRPGNWDLFYQPAPGAPLRPLTDHPAPDYGAAFSPDGRYVVFTSERRGQPDLYVLDLRTGGAPRLLVDSPAFEDQAAVSPDGQSLAFVSTRDGTADVFVVPFRPDQTGCLAEARNLTQHAGGDFRPAFSPDGTLIAFSSDRDEPVEQLAPAERRRGGEIYVMRTDGSGLARLTREPGWDGSPSWTADGRTILFYSERGGVAPERAVPRIWAMNADGGRPRPISPPETLALDPIRFPEGRVGFSLRRFEGGQHRFGIVSANLDGSDLRPESEPGRSVWGARPQPGGPGLLVLAQGPLGKDEQQGFEHALEFGLGEGPVAVDASTIELPDRRLLLRPVRDFSIAVHPERELIVRALPPGPRLVVSDLSGRDERDLLRIDPPQNHSLGLAWSSDGKRLFYSKGAMFAESGEAADVWAVGLDGTGDVNLTPGTAGNDGQPALSADGRWLAFRSGRSGNFDIWIAGADGANPRNVTRHPARDSFPALSPRGDRLVFSSDRDAPGSALYDLYLQELGTAGEPGRVERLTHGGGQDAHAAFSPDGEWIVWTSEAAGLDDEEPMVQSFLFGPQMYGELFARRLRDGLTVRLTQNKWEDATPQWVRGARELAP